MEKDYYTLSNGIQAQDLCRDLNFNCGNIIKYIVRAGRKVYDGMTATQSKFIDLCKAQDYLRDELERTWEREAIAETEMHKVTDPIDIFADTAPTTRKRGHAVARCLGGHVVAVFPSLRAAELAARDDGRKGESDTTIYRATRDGRTLNGHTYKSVPANFE